MAKNASQNKTGQNKTGQNKASHAVEKSALEIAVSIQRPGQTKEQTKLVARGIEKGIALYKKRHSAKARELDRSLKQLKRQNTEPSVAGADESATVRYRQHWLPWALLALTWVGIVGVVVVSSQS